MTPRSVALVMFLLGLSGCERGCLSGRLGARPEPGAADVASTSLSGTDCSDGLARCTDGRLESSVAGHVPHPCVTTPERSSACECPWTPLGRCAAGCVKDGLEVVAATEIATVQLCNPSEPALRPILPAEAATVTICADEVVSCADGIVRTCSARGQPARLVTGCVWGCAPGVRIEPGDLATGDGVAMILCRRAHAERR